MGDSSLNHSSSVCGGSEESLHAVSVFSWLLEGHLLPSRSTAQLWLFDHQLAKGMDWRFLVFCGSPTICMEEHHFSWPENIRTKGWLLFYRITSGFLDLIFLLPLHRLPDKTAKSLDVSLQSSFLRTGRKEGHLLLLLSTCGEAPSEGHNSEPPLDCNQEAHPKAVKYPNLSGEWGHSRQLTAGLVACPGAWHSNERPP